MQPDCEHDGKYRGYMKFLIKYLRIRSRVFNLLLIVYLCSPSIVTTPALAEQLQQQDSTVIGGCPVFPENNIWNTPIVNLPVHARSDQWVNTIGRYSGFHMDFGSGKWDGGNIGIPYNAVSGGVTKVPISFYYPDESDPGPYPIPTNPLIEYGSDHHILIVDNSTCTLYELYDASYSGGIWHAGSGAIWNLNSNALRPDTWTSADAAGLPILPGLVRYEEILGGEIKHAIRFTASNTNGYIWPARHLTSNNPTPQIPPMGARFRLKASFNISGYPPELQIILNAMKIYGIILADNGSNWYVSGAPDERWDNSMLHLLDNLTGNNFEAVDTSGLMVTYDSGATGNIISGNAGVTGTTLSYINNGPQAVTANGGGNYSIRVPSGWSGRVTPSKACYTFWPIYHSYTNILTDQIAQDYTATYAPTSYSLAGNTGIAGVTLTYTEDTLKTVVSDLNGNFSISVPCGWTGTVTPSLAGYFFLPSNKPYTNVLANQTDQNYTAILVKCKLFLPLIRR
jgi:hypothetical protein